MAIGYGVCAAGYQQTHGMRYHPYCMLHALLLHAVCHPSLYAISHPSLWGWLWLYRGMGHEAMAWMASRRWRDGHGMSRIPPLSHGVLAVLVERYTMLLPSMVWSSPPHIA